MDVNQLETFVAIVESGSFSAAAQRVHSVQSNVTGRIRKLESRVGGTLFERGRSGAKLTPLGECLLPHARDILERLRCAESELRDYAGAAAPLRIGALDTFAGSRLPGVLAELVRRTPKAPVSVQTGPSSVLCQRVMSKAIDAAFVVGPVDEVRFGSVLAFREELVIARPARTPGTNALLAFPTNCSYRAVALKWLQRNGHSDVAVREFGSLDAILGCVSAGLGFTIAPRSAIETYNDLDALTLEPIGLPEQRSETHLIWRSEARITRTLSHLQEIVQTLHRQPA